MQLTLTNLSKRFGDTTVLDGVHADIKAQSTVIIGPSGGGKTTLLRILAGLEYPSGGAVVMNGTEVDYREEALIGYRKGIGMVFQAYNLFPHLTALENIMLPLEKVHGHSKRDAKEIGCALLERFRLAEHSGKRPGQLSGGQKQRIAISRAVAIKPRVLLFDEPTSALDPEFTAEVLDMIEELKDEGRDLVLVTHEMGFARSVADRILFVAGGKIPAEGPPEAIFNGSAEPEVSRFLERVLRY